MGGWHVSLYLLPSLPQSACFSFGFIIWLICQHWTKGIKLPGSLTYIVCLWMSWSTLIKCKELRVRKAVGACVEHGRNAFENTITVVINKIYLFIYLWTVELASKVKQNIFIQNLLPCQDGTYQRYLNWWAWITDDPSTRFHINNF